MSSGAGDERAARQQRGFREAAPGESSSSLLFARNVALVDKADESGTTGSSIQSTTWGALVAGGDLGASNDDSSSNEASDEFANDDDDDASGESSESSSDSSGPNNINININTNRNNNSNSNNHSRHGNSSESCESLDDILATRPSRATGWVFGSNYMLIFIFGLLGNVITLYVLLCKGKKRSAQDILIANLACSDIMLCVFAVPITPKYLILDGHWTLGPALCKLVSFAQSTSVYMSTYSLICIGYIRYRLIVHPLEESMSKRTALFSCLGTWMVSILVTLPYMLQVRLSPENCDIKFCDEAWEKPYRFVFSLFTTFFQFIIPLGSVGFFNKKIYSRLDGRRLGGSGASGASGPPPHHHHPQHPQPALADKSAPLTATGSNSHAGSKSTSGQKLAAEPALGTPTQRASHAPAGTRDVLAIKEQRQRDKEKRMRKANNRLIFVVVIFAHSWLPLNLFNLAQDYFEAMSHWPYLTFTFLLVHQVACSSVCWNPILYAWMSETYRQDLRIALPKFIAARLVSCLTEPSSLHSTGDARHSHATGATGATHLVQSQYSLGVQANHGNGHGAGATPAGSSQHLAADQLEAPASPAAASGALAPLAQQTSVSQCCEQLHERASGTAPSSCALELDVRRATANGQQLAQPDQRSDITFDDADDQQLCCCRQLAEERAAANNHGADADQRSQSSSGARQQLTNGTAHVYRDAAAASAAAAAAAVADGPKLMAIRSASREHSVSSLPSASSADFDQRRSSCCSMLSSSNGATPADAKSAQIVI